MTVKTGGIFAQKVLVGMPVDIFYERALCALKRDRERRVKQNRARVCARKRIFCDFECVSALRVFGGVLFLSRFERVVKTIS